MAGKTRTRLARLLTDALRREGYDVEECRPEDLHEAKGWYRTSGSYQNEALRWEGTVRLRGSAVGVSVDSYTTMTQIVRSGGVTIQRDGRVAVMAYDATGN